MNEKELIEREEILEDIIDALEDGDYEEVEDMADEAIESFPEDAFGYFYMGEARYLQYDYEEAAHFYQQAVSKALNNSEYIARLALVNSKLEADEKARTLYQKVLDINPEHVDSLVAMGVYALNDDNHAVALDYLNKAILIEPTHAEAYKVRYVVLQMLGRMEDSLKDIDVLIQIDPQDSQIFQQKLNVLEVLSDEKALLDTFNTWIDRFPNDSSAYYSLANYHMHHQKYQQAEQALDQYISLAKYGDYEVMDGYLMRAWSLLHQQKSEKAQDDFEKVLFLNPQKGQAYIGIAEVLMHQKQSEAALSYLDLGLNIVQKEAWMLAEKKAAILIDAEQSDEALSTLDFLTLHEEEEIQGIGFLNQGKIYQKLGKLEQAYESWKKAQDCYNFEADNYLELYCEAFEERALKQREGALLADMQADFKANAQSKILRQFFGKFWTADVKLTASKNEMFAQIPAKMEKQILSLLSNICVAIEPQGIIVLNAGFQGVRMLYQQVVTKADKVTIKGIPLHDSNEKELELAVSGKNMILRGFGDKEADIDLYLSAADSFGGLSKLAAKEFTIAATAGDLDYMGAAFLATIQ